MSSVDIELEKRNWPRSLLLAAVAGAGLFFCFGPWASDTLVNYGFEIFVDATFTQDVALVVGIAIAYPAIFVVEYDSFSRGWFALNGALWGCVLYLASLGVARIRERLRLRRE